MFYVGSPTHTLETAQIAVSISMELTVCGYLMTGKVKGQGQRVGHILGQGHAVGQGLGVFRNQGQDTGRDMC